ncbi:hypothetical protein Ocin01_09750, partial [Orchesella cincta]
RLLTDDRELSTIEIKIRAGQLATGVKFEDNVGSEQYTYYRCYLLKWDASSGVAL